MLNYKQKLLLNNSANDKYLQVNSEFESPCSKNFEVALSELGGGKPSGINDEWQVHAY